MDPRGKCPDLWIQEIIWLKKFSLQGRLEVRWLALGFGEADPRIQDNLETISSALEGKWDGDDLIYKPKLEKC